MPENDEKNQILDTLLFKENKIFFKTEHYERTFETYQFLKKLTSLTEVAGVYDVIEQKLMATDSNKKLIRLLFSTQSPTDYQIEVKDLQALNSPVRLLTVTDRQPIDITNRYKWTDRERWEEWLKDLSEPHDDVLVINEKLQVVETSRFNVFLHDLKTDLVLTPTLESGCLNGVFRRNALKQQHIQLPCGSLKKISEKDFSIEEIKPNTFFVANSVRGILSALV